MRTGSGYGSFTRFHGPANSATTPGEDSAHIRAIPACGRKFRRPGAGAGVLPIELPTHDYSAVYRPGNNLFAESIVAVDVKTGSGNGTTSWCTTDSGTWIFRVQPILTDITINGRTVKALAQPTKQAFLYVLEPRDG